MTWKASKLKERCQILLPVQTYPDGYASGRVEYTKLRSVWGALMSVSFRGTMTEFIRGVQVNDQTTHTLFIRAAALDYAVNGSFTEAFGDGYAGEPEGLYRSFDLGFSIGFDSIVSLTPVKSDLMIKVLGRNYNEGRLFKILGTQKFKEQDEYYLLSLQEEQELGTKYG